MSQRILLGLLPFPNTSALPARLSLKADLPASVIFRFRFANAFKPCYITHNRDHHIDCQFINEEIL